MRRSLALAGFGLLLTSSLTAAAERHGLFIPPQATDIDRKVLRIKHSVLYAVPEMYPATNTLEFITRSLAAAGWRPETRVESPHEWSSHDSGWLAIPSGDGSSAASLWSATWVNAAGARVHYSLAYPSLDQHGLQPTHVHVAVWYEDRKTADRTRANGDAAHETIRCLQRALRGETPCPK